MLHCLPRLTRRCRTPRRWYVSCGSPLRNNGMEPLKWATQAPQVLPGGEVTGPEWFGCVPLDSLRSRARVVADVENRGNAGEVEPVAGEERFLAIPWWPVDSLTGKTRPAPLRGGVGGPSA